jgi:hypothetical protein
MALLWSCDGDGVSLRYRKEGEREDRGVCEAGEAEYISSLPSRHYRDSGSSYIVLQLTKETYTKIQSEKRGSQTCSPPLS